MSLISDVSILAAGLEYDHKNGCLAKCRECPYGIAAKVEVENFDDCPICDDIIEALRNTENSDNGNKKFFSGYKLGASLKNY